MPQRDPLRFWVSRNLQPIAFLGAYFATIVAGNLVYATPIGEATLRASGFDPALLRFDNTFTVGFWVLLLCPFVVTPIVVAATRRIASTPVQWAASLVDDLTPAAYSTLAVLCYAFVLFRFWQADVATLFTSGETEASSVEARFEILGRIGYFTLVALQSFLPFLTIYSVIRAIRGDGPYWMVATLLNIMAMSVLLILLNMKWPVLLFYIGIVMAVFVYSKRWAYLKAAIGAVLLVGAFLMVSAFVLRIAPASQAIEPAPEVIVSSEQPATPAEDRLTSQVLQEQILSTSKSAVAYAPALLMNALNRMAVTYPYYYEIFTEEGPVCGGILDQLQFGQKCRPSTFVYGRIFKSDGFKGRGTSPSAVHVSGYAVGGWAMAFTMLVGASIVLGLFASIPLDRSAVTGTLVIVGALAGYHMSQVPLEGVIVFDHGLLWTGLLLLVILGWSLYHTRAWRTGR